MDEGGIAGNDEAIGGDWRVFLVIGNLFAYGDGSMKRGSEWNELWKFSVNCLIKFTFPWDQRFAHHTVKFQN